MSRNRITPCGKGAPPPQTGRDEQWLRELLLTNSPNTRRRRHADQELADIDAKVLPEDATDEEFREHYGRLSAALTKAGDLLNEAVHLRNIAYSPKVSPLRVRLIGRSRRERRPSGHRRTARTSPTSSQDPGSAEGGEPPSDVVAPARAHLTFGLRDIAEVLS